jgi:hypothetical protein
MHWAQLTERGEMAIYRAQFCKKSLAVPVAEMANRGRVVRFAQRLRRQHEARQ